MKDSLQIVPPRALSIVTTDRCTARCVNCCFQCSPKGEKMLSFNDMKRAIDECIAKYESIKLIVFTGGECFLLGKDLDKIIEYANSKQLFTRVVSNGYWARSFKKTYQRLLELKIKGLTELNLSTGDEHLEWIPKDNIVNAIIAASKLDLVVAVNVECHNEESTKENCLTSDIRLRKYISKENSKLKIFSGKWISFDGSEDNNPTSNQNSINSTINLNDKCTSLFNTVTLYPDFKVYACCGLTSKGNPYLYLGDSSKHSLDTLYESQFNDFMKIWLYTESPKEVLKFCYSKKEIPFTGFENTHICEICKEIFNEDNLKILQTNYKEQYANVFLKYTLINTKNKKRYERKNN